MKQRNSERSIAGLSVLNCCNVHFLLSSVIVLLFIFALLSGTVKAQDTLTGAFEGRVYNKDTNAPIPDAIVRFTNQTTNVPNAKRSDSEGRFYQGLLNPGVYIIEVNVQGYKPYRGVQALVATRQNTVQPAPIPLEPENNVATTTPSPDPQAVTKQDKVTTDKDKVSLGAGDARRDGAFTENQVSSLPLGNRTYTRTFDELALLLPGVTESPQTVGNGTGPGIGAGVGSSGQFSVNGLRSRANNFTVDGSDNNDEDIGVRRQGFFALVPQPIESIKEYQVMTLLAPAQFGRNIGAQVNAISKSGGNTFHGSLYGMGNFSQLNSRNFFDSTSGNTRSPLRAGNKNVFIDNRQAFTNLNTGGDDLFRLFQAGGNVGGPIWKNKMFFFVSGEGLSLASTKESNFAVPTIEQRGAFRSGATGLSVNPFTNLPIAGGEFPTTVGGDAIFSYFPFPNNPNGVYGANTLTQVLPSNAKGGIFSAKYDYNFKLGDHAQSFTARYNVTQDRQDLPVTGGGLFSGLRPRVKTHNFSTFLNSELSGPNSTSPIFNQLRVSYGRTQLRFDEIRDNEFLLPVRRNFNNPDDARFLLNARRLFNNTLPGATNVFYDSAGETETGLLGNFLGRLGPIGQLIVAGFSPVGVDVFNFPQKRANNTYQIADTLTMRIGGHNLAFGTDIRRTELISDLPRNARPLVTFYGAPRVFLNVDNNGLPTSVRFASPSDCMPGNIYCIQAIRPEDYAAAGAANGFFQSLVQAGKDANINLSYYQLNFFGQDEWRIRSNLSLSFGLRYEYNTPPREAERRIENTFAAQLPPEVAGLKTFLAGRTKIFEPSRNNYSPRISLAYAPNWFGNERGTVIRVGYGIYYDQIIGSVVSQSRNVLPTFATVNFGGGCCGADIYRFGINSDFGLHLFNPLSGIGFNTPNGFIPIIQNGTVNTINPALLSIPNFNLISNLNNFFPLNQMTLGNGTYTANGNTFGATLPSAVLDTPAAHHYSISVEQQLSSALVISAAYVGTSGRHLLRFSTPNLGSNFLILTDIFQPDGSTFGGGTFSGITLDPGGLLPSGQFSSNRGRPNNRIGPISLFETVANSRYDSFQLQARGRLGRSFQYQANYTLSEVTDDVSDVFDLAGASALPQNSLTRAGESGPSNFDARHRFAYSFVYNLPDLKDRSKAVQHLFGNWQISSSGIFRTGQPFTVNSIFDVNLDGNLTDRLSNTQFIVQTGDRSQPLGLSTNDPNRLLTMLAPWGRDGSVGRNTFRAGNLMTFDVSFSKDFHIDEKQTVRFRVDVFNITNRANFGIPVRFLEAPGFGKATDTVTPGRRIQFSLKYVF